jgi:uncharacterized membrane protein YfcA
MRAVLVLAGVGFVAQLIDGSLGMAYGATSSTLVLAAGVAPAAASASVHLAELGTTAVAGFSHWRFGNVDWQTVRRIGVPGALGAFLGAVVLSSISGEIAEPWMAAILLAIGVYVLLRFTLGGVPASRGRPYVRLRYLVPLGFGAGFVDATGGGGWGPVATPTLIATGKMEPRKVIGSVDTSEFLVALLASIGFLLGLGTSSIPFSYVVALLIGGVAAAPIAAWLVRFVTARLLGAAVGGLIVLTNARTLFEVFELEADLRAPAYVCLASVWVFALGIVVRQLRRDGLSLTNRPGCEAVSESSA